MGEFIVLRKAQPARKGTHFNYIFFIFLIGDTIWNKQAEVVLDYCGAYFHNPNHAPSSQVLNDDVGKSDALILHWSRGICEKPWTVRCTYWFYKWSSHPLNPIHFFLSFSIFWALNIWSEPLILFIMSKTTMVSNFK